MILALAVPALAEPPVRPDLEEAERTAAALILDCRQHGAACGATDGELAEAFVTVAVAAAALRGELDRQAVADAEALDPTAIARWRSVVPTAADRPDPWVMAWVDGPVPDDPIGPRSARVSPRKLVPAPSPAEVQIRATQWSPSPLALGGIRLGLSGVVPVGKEGIVLSADSAHGRRYGQDSVAVGLGTRLANARGAELVVVAGVSAFAHRGPGQLVVGAGPLLGGTVELPLDPRGRVALRADEIATWSITLGPPTLRLGVRDSLGFEVHPTPTVGLTAGFEIDISPLPEGWPEVWTGVDLGLTVRR